MDAQTYMYLCASQKYLQHQCDLYHIFIGFKKALDMVWHNALWSTMMQYHIGDNLTCIIEQLYNKSSSAIINNGWLGECFCTSTGVRQGYLPSPTLFNIFLDRLMTNALDDHAGTISTGERVITNLWFPDDIDCLAGKWGRTEQTHQVH